MAYSLIWLPEVLRKAGLKVAETEGWASRGRAEMGTVRGVMCHHTGTVTAGNMPTLRMLIQGRKEPNPLNGPLSQLGLGRDGTYYVIAAGRANHAGAGQWKGIKTGNSSFIGIEAENAGTPDAKFPEWQMDAYRRGVAAILRHIGATEDMCCGHREYAPARKIDPLFDMDIFRAAVGDIMRMQGASRPIVPAVDAVTGRPTLQRGSRGVDVVKVQEILGTMADGKFGPATEALVRRFQFAHGLREDGVVGPRTWELLLEAPAAGPAAPVAPAAASAAGDEIPAGPRLLLERIGQIEANGEYGMIYAKRQRELTKPLTEMTVSEIIKAGPSWRRRFGSSACGRYQFMTDTLITLSKTEKLTGSELFSQKLQDSLGYALLKRRGVAKFLAKQKTPTEFGLDLAKEWASFPVLADCPGAHRSVRRGETYYAGDRLNRALVKPEEVEELLERVLT